MILGQATQPAFKVISPISFGEGARIFFSSMWNLFTGLPWWCYVVIALLIVARLVFGPLGDPPKRRRR